MEGQTHRVQRPFIIYHRVNLLCTIVEICITVSKLSAVYAYYQCKGIIWLTSDANLARIENMCGASIEKSSYTMVPKKKPT